MGATKRIDWLDLISDVVDRLDNNVINLMEGSRLMKPLRIAALIGSLVDVEGLYVLHTFIKMYGGSDIQHGDFRFKANLDAPFFYGFNRAVSSFNDLGAVLLIGTNPRFEASLINTLLRKQQNRRALPYYSVGAFADMRLRHDHLGNSVRALVAISENRLPVAKSLYNLASSSVFVGFDNTKTRGAPVLQNIVRFVSRKLYAKTKSGERLGFLHSNVGSMNMAALGFDAAVRSPLHVEELKDKNIATIFALQTTKLSKKWLSLKQYTNVVALSTHKGLSYSYDHLVPIKNFYEKEGHLFNIEGRLRRYQRAVTSPKESRSVEMFLASLTRTRHS